jgi:multimeric flavodoxin WrbA
VVGVVEVLVLYYSRTGNVEAMAKAVAEGANSVEGASSKLRRVDYANVDDFITCDAVAFGSPNYFGYMAGLMKDFFDKAWLVREKVSGKLAAAFTCGGSSSNAALLSLEKMYSSFKLEKVSEGVAWGTREQGKISEQILTACKKIGEALAKAAIEKEAKVPTD